MHLERNLEKKIFTQDPKYSRRRPEAAIDEKHGLGSNLRIPKLVTLTKNAPQLLLLPLACRRL